MVGGTSHLLHFAGNMELLIRSRRYDLEHCAMCGSREREISPDPGASFILSPWDVTRRGEQGKHNRVKIRLHVLSEVK